MNHIILVSDMIIAIFAIVTGIFAWKQHKLNKSLLKIECYSRREKIYNEMRGFLERIMMKGNVERNDSIRLISNTRPAKFLFRSDSIIKYINELYLNSISFTNQMREIYSKNIDDVNKNKLLGENEELMVWFSNQIEVLDKKFEKYLSLKT